MVYMPARLLLLPALLLAAVALASCTGADEQRPPATLDHLDRLSVPAVRASGGRRWDGVVEAVRQATLTAQTSGRVAEVRRDVGDRVAEGEVLVRLSAVEQQSGVDVARAQLRAAQAAADEAESDYRRYLELSQGQYVSRSQLEQVRAARDSAVAARDAARAQVASVGQQAAYTVVRAPYPGVVASRDVEPGESVSPGQPLLTVFALEALRIELSVPQSDAAAIRAEPSATVHLTNGHRIEDGRVTVFPAADTASHSVRVRVDLPALDTTLTPGTTAKVVFPAVAGEGWPRVPASALVHRGEVNAVYVLADGRLSLRQLRLGAQHDGQVDVISGLAAGETIATDPVAAAQALVVARQGED